MAISILEGDITKTVEYDSDAQEIVVHVEIPVGIQEDKPGGNLYEPNNIYTVTVDKRFPLSDVSDSVSLTEGEPAWTATYNVGTDKIDSNIQVDVTVDGTAVSLTVDETNSFDLADVEDAISLTEGTPTWTPSDAVAANTFNIQFEEDVTVDGTTVLQAVDKNHDFLLSEIETSITQSEGSPTWTGHNFVAAGDGDFAVDFAEDVTVDGTSVVKSVSKTKHFTTAELAAFGLQPIP